MIVKILRKKKSNINKLHLLQLPNEILSRIVSDVNVYHRQKIRASCRRLKEICDAQTLHEFKKAVLRKRNTKEFSSQAIAAIKTLSTVYVNAGLESVFAGALISHMKMLYKTTLFEQENSIKPFVRNFVQLADQIVPGQQGRLLYCLTILNLLKVRQTFFNFPMS